MDSSLATELPANSQPTVPGGLQAHDEQVRIRGGISNDLFWYSVRYGANESEHKAHELGRLCGGIVTIILTVIGVVLLDAVGLFLGASVGLLVMAIIVFNVQKYRPYTKLGNLTPGEVTILVDAVRNYYGDLSCELAEQCLEGGIIDDLYDQLINRRL